MLRPISERARREILRFDTDVPIDRAWTPPASWYTDPDIYELERRALFARTWHPVARASQLADIGSYVAGCSFGTPWVVTRADDNRLRAFHNVCRHKGREVVVGSGTAANGELVCGYHGWRYGIDGALRSAPRIAGIKDFERDDMGLPPIAVETWGPWVLINPDSTARPVAESLATLGTLLDQRRWKDLRFHSSKHWDIKCNWKVYVDNYLDGGYHIPHMHPTLDAQLDMSTYRTECFDTYSIQSSGGATSQSELLDVDPRARIGEGAIYAWTFPNFMINVYGDCMDTNRVEPIGVDRCRVHYEFYFAMAEADFIETSIRQSDVTQREDIEICESVQVGLSSPSYDRGRYAPRVEQGEHHFHRLVARALRAGLT